MVKSELINRLAEKQENLSLRDIDLSVNYILEKMSESLANGGRIEIRGFGSFSLHYRPPRRAHNPKTGAQVQTQGKHSPHFKPGKELRERVIASYLQGKPIIDTKEEDEGGDQGDNNDTKDTNNYSDDNNTHNPYQ